MANTICENFYDGAFPVKFRYAMSHVSFPRWGAADYTMATREEKYVASSCLWAQASNALEYPAAINLPPTRRRRLRKSTTSATTSTK